MQFDAATIKALRADMCKAITSRKILSIIVSDASIPIHQIGIDDTIEVVLHELIDHLNRTSLPGLIRLLSEVEERYPEADMPAVRSTHAKLVYNSTDDQHSPTEKQLKTALRALRQEHASITMADSKARHQVIEEIGRVKSQLRNHRLTKTLPPITNHTVLGDRYEIQALIGEGAYAQVYRAVDLHEDLSPAIAIKVLRRELYHDDSVVERFKSGARLASDKHRQYAGMVPVLEIHVREAGDPYIYYTMPFFEAGDLEKSIQYEFAHQEALVEKYPKKMLLTLQEKIDIICDVGNALICLHENLIFHRDVCPANILLKLGRNAVRGALTDLDLAYSLADPKHTHVRLIQGKLRYMAPELISNSSLATRVEVYPSPRTDLYSLAATLVYSITGHGWDINSLNEEHPVFESIPPHLQSVLRSSCSKDPRDRPRNVQAFIEILKDSGPRASLDRTLRTMRSMQGAELDSASIDKLAQQQTNSCAFVFAHASQMREVWHSRLDSLSTLHCDSPLIKPVCDILRIVAAFRDRTSAAISFKAIECTLLELTQEIESIRCKDRGSDGVLFLEYICGLVCCEVFIYLGACFVDYHTTFSQSGGVPDSVSKVIPNLSISNDRNNLDSYTRGLQGSFDTHEACMKYLRIWYRSANRQLLWSHIYYFWHTILNSSQRAAVNHLVSLRGCDNSPSEWDQLITLSQVMHWDGWGGTGSFLRAVNTFGANSLTKLLEANVKHTFDWHQTAQTESTANFSHRKDFFAPPAVALTEYAAGCTATILIHPSMSTYRLSEQVIRIWGDAVGPKRVAEGRIMENIMVASHHLKAIEPRSYHMTLTDASGLSLQQLLAYPIAASEYRHLLLRDLNIDFPGEPSAGEPTSSAAVGSFDCYSCSVALHQVADSRRRLFRIRKIFAFATRILRVGGVISTPDVSSGVVLQAFILPVNTVDREGGWASDIYSLRDESGGRISMLDVASTMNGQYCKGWTNCEVHASATIVKFPLPLLQLRRGAPTLRHLNRVEYVYEYLPYIIVTTSLEKLKKFDYKWENCHETTRLSLVKSMLAEWDCTAIEILDDVPRIVKELGYHIADLDS